MGYRVRLSCFPKKDADLIRNMSKEALETLFHNTDNALYRPAKCQELYEIGKYPDFSNSLMTNFYSFELDEEEFKIVSKESLQILINQYKAEIASNYQNLVDNFKKEFQPLFDRKDKSVTKMEVSFDSLAPLWILLSNKQHDWTRPSYDLLQWKNGLDGEMTRSWSMEYAIFNLMFIYKTFDFENNYLIYSGW